MNTLGQAAEDLAAAHLQAAGLRLLARNHLCRFGEIDLICREGEVVVFVEVRQRRSERFGGAAASITTRKRLRIWRAARHYLMQLGHDRPAASTSSWCGVSAWRWNGYAALSRRETI